MSKRLLDKLEKYEQEAYNAGCGADWLTDIGEGFKFYVEQCIQNNQATTIRGFEKYIDNLNIKRT